MNVQELLLAARDYRKTLEISQGVIADKMNVEMSTISRWETAKAHPSLENFLKYVDLLGLELVVQPKLSDEEKVLGELGCL